MPPKYVYGSGRLNPQATAVGVPNTLRTLLHGSHIPFEYPGPIAAAYADTVFWTIRDFLRPILRQAGAVLASRPAAVAAPTALAYPNPTQGAVQLVLPEAWLQAGEVQLLDATGRVVRHFTPTTQQLQLARGTLNAGMYMLRTAGQAPIRIVFE